ncbi:hypothetical protein ABTM67_19915, partial [Acinetobacter baumannii]
VAVPPEPMRIRKQKKEKECVFSLKRNYPNTCLTLKMRINYLDLMFLGTLNEYFNGSLKEKSLKSK